MSRASYRRVIPLLIMLVALPPMIHFQAASHPAQAATHTYTATPNAPISDGNQGECSPQPGPSLTSTITVPENYNVADVNVLLNITHTFVGDVIITLTHGATTITLLDRPGNPIPDDCTGFDSNNIITTLDDESGGGSVEAANPPTGASYTPNQALTAFDGQNANGDWTLTIIDVMSGDTGTLNSWGLVIDDGIIAVPLVVSAVCNSDNLVVTIAGGNGSFNITGTGPGLSLNNVEAGSYTLTGPGAWTGVTVTELSGDLETSNLGNFNCATNGIVVSAVCTGTNLVVTIEAGDSPFNIVGSGSGLPLNNVEAGSYTLTGPGAWTGVTIVETGGNLQSSALGDFTCAAAPPPPSLAGIPVPNLGLIMINLDQAQFALQSPHGEPLALLDGTPVLLPHDWDHNGYDTYTVTGIYWIDGDYWLSIFLGNTTWGWVPLDHVTPLTELDLPSAVESTSDSK